MSYEVCGCASAFTVKQTNIIILLYSVSLSCRSAQYKYMQFKFVCLQLDIFINVS